MIDLERHHREESRWRILVALNAGRPTPVPETIVLRTLQDVSIPLTPHGLRRELDYLEDRKLIEISRARLIWMIELTHYGVDIVEYTVPCYPGIARPPEHY